VEIVAIGVVALIIGFFVVRPRWFAHERERALTQQTPALTALADSLGGSVTGPDGAGPWSPKLQARKPRPELTLDFRRGPWHVRVTEVSIESGPLSGTAILQHEHWIEVATVPVPRRVVPHEFFPLTFEDGFVYTECQGQVDPDGLVFAVDVILETLDRVPGVEPRDPAA
jgi:hypothetical protein